MDILQLQKWLNAITAEIASSTMEYVIVGAFLVYAADRVIGLYSAKSTRKMITDWSGSQAHFLGATNDIKSLAKKMGAFAMALVIIKPFLILTGLIYQQPLIDPLGVTIFGSVILYFYYKGVIVFLRRERRGNADRVPIQMKKAWLQLDLHRVGLSLYQIRFALLVIATHTIYSTYVNLEQIKQWMP